MTDTYDKTQGAGLTTGSPAENPNKNANSAKKAQRVLVLDTPEARAMLAMRTIITAQAEDPFMHVCSGDCHCGADSVEVPSSTANSAEAPYVPEPVLDAANSAIKRFTVKDAAGAFGVHFLDKERVNFWVNARLHKYTLTQCPVCGTDLDGETAVNFMKDKRVHCKACGRWFTARTGTFLQGAQLDSAQVFLLAVLIDIMNNGLTPARIAEILGVSVDTVRNWILRFKAFE